VCGFMSKAMIVTLPFLLLLLDVWPLGRLNTLTLQLINPSTFKRLIIEKIPFFAMAALFSVATLWIHSSTGNITPLGVVGMRERLEAATLNYIAYLWKFFWPASLAVIYPYTKDHDAHQVLLCGLLLLAISALCLLQLSRRPYLAVGWFWYLVALLPVTGIVKAGVPPMADRYTYVPLIGPTISLVWLAWDWAQSQWSKNQNSPSGLLSGKILPSFAVVVLAACVVVSHRQLMLWRDTVPLFEHTVNVTSENALAQFPLAQGLDLHGQLRQAAVHYRIALALHPDNNHYLSNLYLAGVLARLRHYRGAEACLGAALELMPTSATAMNNLAWLLATCPVANCRDGARAVELAEGACRLRQYRTTMFIGTLAAAYAEAGRFNDATATAQRAIALARQHGETELAARNERLLQLYQAHKAYHTN